MRLLTTQQITAISAAWEATTIAEQDRVYRIINQVDARIKMPLGELLNPKLASFIQTWNLQNIIKIGRIPDNHTFATQGLEGMFSVDIALPTAILAWREVKPTYRMHIYIDSKWKMPDRWATGQEGHICTA